MSGLVDGTLALVFAALVVAVVFEGVLLIVAATQWRRMIATGWVEGMRDGLCQDGTGGVCAHLIRSRLARSALTIRTGRRSHSD